MTDDELMTALLDQEQRLQFETFDNGTALSLGTALLERGRRQSLAITIDITRVHQQLFHAALPGTSADYDHWIRRKNAVVYRFGHSSYYIGTLCRQSGRAFEEHFLLDPKKYAPHAGAFPALVKGVGLVGTVTVSGLDQAEDHRLVVETLEAFLKRS